MSDDDRIRYARISDDDPYYRAISGEVAPPPAPVDDQETEWVMVRETGEDGGAMAWRDVSEAGRKRAQGFEYHNGGWYYPFPYAPGDKFWNWHPMVPRYAKTMIPHPLRAGEWLMPEAAFWAMARDTYAGSGGKGLDKFLTNLPIYGALALLTAAVAGWLPSEAAGIAPEAGSTLYEIPASYGEGLEVAYGSMTPPAGGFTLPSLPNLPPLPPGVGKSAQSAFTQMLNAGVKAAITNVTQRANAPAPRAVTPSQPVNLSPFYPAPPASNLTRPGNEFILYAVLLGVAAVGIAALTQRH